MYFMKIAAISNVDVEWVQKNLVRERVLSCSVSSDTFTLGFRYGTLKIFHEQDSCEVVTLEVDSQLESECKEMVGAVLTTFECVSSRLDSNYDFESQTWTFYRIACGHYGSVVLKWQGESNGYYSEEVGMVWEGRSDLIGKMFTAAADAVYGKVVDECGARGGKMLSYHNDPKIKEAIIKKLVRHYELDEIVQGTYWENGKGCAIGCTIDSNDHAEYEKRFGIPEILARLEDRIFEGLALGDAKEWPIQFMKAIPVGVDLSRVQYKFMHWLLTDSSINPGMGHSKFSTSRIPAKS